MSAQAPQIDRPALIRGIAASKELEIRQEHRRIINSLEAFAKAFWHIVEPRRPLVWGWHLTLMCRELERSYRGQLPGDLVINIPPRHSKSSFVGILGPAWWWLHQPECQFLAITKADKNAKRDARHMRRVVDCPPYRDLVARQAGDGNISDGWDWSADQNEVRYFANSAGGHRISMTTDTDVTGAGADILLIDDPHDAEEMGGGAERAKRLADEVWDKFQEVWATRLNAGGRTQCIMQRLLEDDLAGHFLKQPEITKLVLPLEYEPDHPHLHPEDQRTEPGEVLTVGRFSENDLKRLKATPSMFAGQAQQRPAPKGGGQIKREWFRKFYRMDPRVMAAICSEVAVTVDAARKANVDADFHSIQVWGRLGARRILIDRRCERLTYPQFEKVLDGVITNWKPSLILIEDTANGTTYLQCREGVVPMVAFHPSSDTPGTDKSKPARAIYVERAAEANQIELPDPSICSWVEEWIYNITTFPSGLHDDDMDAASQLMMRWSLKASAEVDALAAIQARTAALKGMH